MAESISLVQVPHECELLAGIMFEKKGWLLTLSADERPPHQPFLIRFIEPQNERSLPISNR